MPKIGYISCSQFAKVMTNGRGKDEMGQTAISYLKEVAMGREDGVDMEELTLPALEHGNLYEDTARQIYIQTTGNEVYNSGWLELDSPSSIGLNCPPLMVGGTTDGLIGMDGMIEIKNPYRSINHYLNRKEQKFVKDYWWQVQGYMMLTGREFCHIVSYDYRFQTIEKQLVIINVKRDDAAIQQLVDRLVIADEWVNEYIERDGAPK